MTLPTSAWQIGQLSNFRRSNAFLVRKLQLGRPRQEVPPGPPCRIPSAELLPYLDLFPSSTCVNRRAFSTGYASAFHRLLIGSIYRVKSAEHSRSGPLDPNKLKRSQWQKIATMDKMGNHSRSSPRFKEADNSSPYALSRHA